MKLHYLLAALILVLASCKPKQSAEDKQRLVETGTIDKSLAYTAEEVGWKTSLPGGWNLMTPEETAKMRNEGLKAMEKAVGTPIDASGLKQLVNLKKDQFNNFLSTIEPFDPAKQGSYEENQKGVKEILLNTYKNGGIKLGEVSDGKEMVDGLEFYTLDIELLHPKTGAPILNQKMYSRHLNGYDFGMTMTTNNDKDRQILMGVITASKFSKRS